MDANRAKDVFRNAFIYALVTTIMVLGAAAILSSYFGAQQRALADRVDRNSAAIVCILQLGVEDKAPNRTTENVQLCIANPNWLASGG